MYFVYALYNSLAKKIYIGQTNDLNKRLAEHNDPDNFLSKYTKKYTGKWELIYNETLSMRSEAILREKQLKSSRGRSFIHSLVKLRP